MNELKIGNITVKLPIIQGGMGVGISLSSLAAAVANEGGIGVISTAAIGINENDFFSNFLEANIRALKKEIRKARAKAIYSEDESLELRKSHENPSVVRIYKEFLTDGPCGHISHKLLHTYYIARGKYIGKK